MSQGAWSNLESLHLVQKELDYTGRNINKGLALQFPGRSPSDIANRRRTVPHRALLNQIRADRAEAAPDSADISPVSNDIATDIVLTSSPVVDQSLTRINFAEEIFEASPTSVASSSSRVTTPSYGPKISFDCVDCGKIFTSRPYLLKHRKRGCIRDNVCPYCSTEFPSFSGMRQHMKKSHPEEYFDELEALKTKTVSSEIYESLALAEVMAPPDVNLVLHLITTTGLSIDAIRYRRKQDVYSQYIDLARKSRQIHPPPSQNDLPATSVDSLPNSSKNGSPSPPSTNSIITQEMIPASDVSLFHIQNDSDRQQPDTNLCSGTNATGSPFSPATKTLDRSLDSSSTSLPGAPVVIQHQVSIYFDNDGNFQHIPASDNNSNISEHCTSKNVIAMADTSLLVDEIVSCPSDGYPLQAAINDFSQHQVTPPASVRVSDVQPQSQLPIPNTTMANLLAALQRQANSAQLLSRDNPLLASIDHLLSGRIDASGNSFENWLTYRFRNARPARPDRRNPNGPRRYPQATEHQNRNSRRQALYKKTQDLFAKNRRLLADIILSERPLDGPGVDPPVREFENIFRSTIENPSDPDDDPITPVPLSDESIDGLNSLLLPEDIKRAKIGWSSSSPGSDGVTVPMVKSVKEHELALAFNILLISSYQPQAWKVLRTVMVPKKGSLRDANNWRPITIGSTIQRLFHRALNHKLTDNLKLHMAQRGFVQTDGTLANSILLDHYIHSRSDRRKPYFVMSLDLTRAFDNLSHGSIRRALHRFQFPVHLHNYIMSTYDATTILRTNGYCSDQIRILRGVRQGDPLSPFIFNLVLDELLCASEFFPHCTSNDISIPPVLAFADDLIVMSDTKSMGQEILDRTASFLARRGLSTNSNKCHALAVDIVRGALLPSRTPVFSINGNPIPPVTGLNSFSYLGHEFSHSGILRPNISNLPTWLHNLQRSLLKPEQKMMILRYNIIPRLMYGLQNPKLTMNILKEGDRSIRDFSKRCLHLHVHTQDTLLHSRFRDGGLGILSLVDVIPRTFSRRMEKLANSNDTVICNVLNSARLKTLRDRFLRLASAPRPGTFIAAQPFPKGLEQCSQDSASNTWISNKPSGWSGRDYVRAIHLRAANLPTVGIPSNPPAARRCRSGCNSDETVCHILQACPTVQDARISRHNYVVGKLARHCNSKGFTTEIEPHVRVNATDRGLDKPDLVIHVSNETSVVCDVQISWDSNNLRDAWIHKRDRYGNDTFIAAASIKWPGRNFIFCPLILGARGIWPSCNRTTENWLQISTLFKRSCINGVLKWGSTLHNIFMRSVRDRNPTRYRRT